MTNCNTGTSSSTSSGAGHNDHVTQTLDSNSSSDTSVMKMAANESSATIGGNNNQRANDEEQGELFLLYRLVRQRNIYHGHNAKSATTSRKKGVMIPQEFTGECFF